MAKAQLENIWEILAEYSFSTDDESYSDFICVLCGKIIIDARQTPCGCRFCMKCIEIYLSQGNRMCPGKSDDCQEEKLDLNLIIIDHFTNRKIMKILVKCPIDKCSIECELKIMSEHLLRCGKQLNTCPYVDLGCNESNLLTNELNQHLELKQNSHLLLMIDAISNLRNENEMLVSGNKILASENKLMKEDLEKKQIAIDQLKFRLELTNEKLENVSQKFELKLSNIEQTNANLGDKLNEVEKLENAERKKLEHQLNINVNKNYSKIREFDCKLDKSIKELINRNLLFTLKKEVEFFWNISKFSEKIKFPAPIFSDSFYTKLNGYKMMISLFPNLIIGLDIYPAIIRGEFDKDLKFPVTCDVTIGIIDEDTKLAPRNYSRRIQYMKQPFDPELKFFFPTNDIPKSVFRNDLMIIKLTVNVIE